MEIALLIWALALTVLLAAGIIWMFDLQNRFRQLQSRYENIFGGAEDDSVGAVLQSLAARLSKTNARTERLVAHTKEIDEALAHAVQGVGLVRFRAFEGTGGDQSFALAMVDGQGNGAVISALYGRDATRIYAKSVEGWLSSRSLTDEEKQALVQARQIVIPVP